MMKKVIQRIINIIIAFISLGLFAGVAYLHYAWDEIFYYIGNVPEILCYIFCAFCYIAVFKKLSEKVTPEWVKWVFSFIPATLFTLQTIFYNTFLNFIDWNFSWTCVVYDELMPYIQFLKNDLTYMTGFGKYRYLLCFVNMYALCAIVIFLQSNRGKKILYVIKKSIYSFLYFESSNELDILINLYQNGRINLNAIVDYFNSMVCSYSEKRKFKKCLVKYPCKVLYSIFLVKFGNTLSEKEINKYCNLWRLADDIPLEKAYYCPNDRN